MLDPEASMPEASLRSLPPPVSNTPGDPKSLFGKDYYERGCGPIPYAHTAHWVTFFGSLADHVIRILRPSRVFDAGCAMGMLVEAFWDRGVEAWGVDVSEYAISQVRRDMQSYCRARSLTEPIDGVYDVITCIEVLEHMSSGDALQAAKNICRASDTILFSSTASDFAEPTHFNVRPPIYWLKLFAGLGFQPVLQFDCDALVPHAMLLRRSPAALPDEALELFADHIRQKSLLAQQARQIRELTRLNGELSAERESLRTALAGAGSAVEEAKRESQDFLEELRREVTALRGEQRLAQAAFERSGTELSELSARLGAAGEAILQLTTGQEEIRHGLGSAFHEIEGHQTAVEQLQTGVGDLRAGVAQTGTKVDSILHSLIWRSLCACGAAALKLGAMFRPKVPPPQVDPTMICDEPPENGRSRTGRVRVSGWALSPVQIIRRVDISVDGGAPVNAKYGLPRPDVAQAFPGLPAAENSGYVLELDTSKLTHGTHTLTLVARDVTGATQTVTRELRIDHDAPDEETGDETYESWIANYDVHDPQMVAGKLKRFLRPPVISIVVPVYRTNPDFLKRAIESVLAQSYPHWELCLADDGSGMPELEQLLNDYRRRDSRIRTVFRKQCGGISAASNTALELASGSWIGLLDHDDELAKDALFYAAEAIDATPELDLIYSDEDKITEGGKRYEPFFKPDWSPDLLRSENYICHFLVFRKELLARTGGFRGECDGSQDYDLILRLTEISRCIHHIPRVLYHWRSTPTSTASSLTAKDYAVAAAERALAEHLKRTCAGALVEPGVQKGWWRTRYEIPRNTRVSILIASGGNCEILKTNLESLKSKTTYPHYEVVVIDNSREREIEQYVKGRSMPGVRYLEWRNKPFNFSAINNAAARQCDSPVLLFLNDDISVIAPDWLTAMVELAVRPEVGAVGAKLLYPGGQIQHAGVILGMFGNCGHAFKDLDGARPHYFNFPDVIRNVSAVTGACLMTRAETFWQVGGFDEEILPVAFQDVDLCLKLGRAGYRVLYTPHALLTHHESLSKTGSDLIPHPREVAEMQSRWGDVIAADPYYNPNLSVTKENYSLRKKTAASKSIASAEGN